MAFNFVVTALFAVLFLGSEGRNGFSRKPCKVRTQTFNAAGHLIDQRNEDYTSVCRNGLECPNDPTKSITYHDESPGSNRTDKTLIFCEHPYCGKFPLCKEREWAAALYINKERRSELIIYCRCRDGFRSLQYAGEDYLNDSVTVSIRLYTCDIPVCRHDLRCMVDTLQDSGNPGMRRVYKECNCSRGQRCNDLRVNNEREKNYYCSNP